MGDMHRGMSMDNLGHWDKQIMVESLFATLDRLGLLQEWISGSLYSDFTRKWL